MSSRWCTRQRSRPGAISCGRVLRRKTLSAAPLPGTWFPAVAYIYGLIAYSVEQRTPEIGVRLALGAEGGGVRRMIVFQGMRLAVVGVIIGASFAFNLSNFISVFLFSVKPWDPLAFTAVPVALSAVALFAVWLPARRASRVNPVDALRYE